VVHAKLMQALAAAYASIETPDTIGEFLCTLAPHFGAEAALLYRFDNAEGANAQGTTHGFDDADFDLYARHYWASDLWRSRGTHVPIGQPVVCSTLVDPAEFQRTPFAGEFLPRLRIVDCLSGWAARDEETNVILSIYTEKSAFDCSAGRLRDFGTLLSHLRRIARLQNSLSTLRRENQLLRGCLNEVETALAVTDRGMRLLEQNDRFLQLCRRHPSIALVGGRLTFRGRRPFTLGPDGASDPRAFGSRFGLEDERGRLVLLVEIVPLERGESLLVSVRERGQAAPDFDYFKALWGLTERECSLLACLYRRLDLRQVSSELELSYDYTRQLVKMLLLKSGTRKQAELIQLLTSTRFE